MYKATGWLTHKSFSICTSFLTIITGLFLIWAGHYKIDVYGEYQTLIFILGITFILIGTNFLSYIFERKNFARNLNWMILFFICIVIIYQLTKTYYHLLPFPHFHGVILCILFATGALLLMNQQQSPLIFMIIARWITLAILCMLFLMVLHMLIHINDIIPSPALLLFLIVNGFGVLLIALTLKILLSHRGQKIHTDVIELISLSIAAFIFIITFLYWQVLNTPESFRYGYSHLPTILLTSGLILGALVGLGIRMMHLAWKNSRELSKSLALVRATLGAATEGKKMEAQLLHQATHDLLTGLPNRLLITDRVQQAIRYGQRAGTIIAVLFFDLNRFKMFNDSFGYVIGDELLKMVAQRLRECMNTADTVARWGDDEFVVLLTQIVKQEDIVSIVQNCLQKLAEAYLVQGHELSLSARVGISVFPKDGDDAATLLKNADSAMHRTETEEGNHFQFYTREMNSQVLERLELENDLRKAIQRNEFALDYQPLLDLKTGKIACAEALIRWHHPKLGVLQPGAFIGLAEEINFIGNIGEWVMRTACNQIKTWHEHGLPWVKISVNLSSQQLKKNLITQITDILKETQVAPQYLELELTESLIINYEAVSTVLSDLKNLGLSLAIDDFGIGYSCISYLKDIPVSKLKLDQSFIRDIFANNGTAALVQAMIAMGHSLRLKIAAEGVESADQLSFLKANDCDEIQGYYFSLPINAETFEAFFLKQTS